jgi:hypothetical protein
MVAPSVMWNFVRPPSCSKPSISCIGDDMVSCDMHINQMHYKNIKTSCATSVFSHAGTSGNGAKLFHNGQMEVMTDQVIEIGGGLVQQPHVTCL